MYKRAYIFKRYTVCVYLFIHNKYTQYKYIYKCIEKLLFWMRLITINYFTAQFFSLHLNITFRNSLIFVHSGVDPAQYVNNMYVNVFGLKKNC